jgi:TonB family protein
VADLRVRQLRLPLSRRRSDRLGKAWAGSAAAHVLVLALLILLRTVVPVASPPEQGPSFAMEFSPDATEPQGGPPSQTPPQSSVQPQMNLMPPEYMQPPTPPAEDAENLPPPMQRPRYTGSPQPRRTASNPFSHPMNFSLAPREQREASAGLRNTRSLDLSAGPMISGGRLRDSVAHTIMRGGEGDYMSEVEDFVETHKYYPPEAGERGEEGGATVEVTVRRDGTVTSVRLVDSSGSQMLDAAWLSVFRDNRLPAFNDDMPENQFTFRYRLNYYLIYRH